MVRRGPGAGRLRRRHHRARRRHGPRARLASSSAARAGWGWSSATPRSSSTARSAAAGSAGCLEAYLADYALAREAATALGRNPRTAQSPHGSLETLFEEAKAGNAAARTIFARAGRYLAVGLANVVQLFDPELIILSGERMRFDFLYADEVLAEMHAPDPVAGAPAGAGRGPCLGRPRLGAGRGGAGARRR